MVLAEVQTGKVLVSTNDSEQFMEVLNSIGE